MAERRGKIVEYNLTNRQGRIQPEDKGPLALFYLPAVTNADPLPKANDIVLFEAPAPRKNKQGKLVQENASAVTIAERAPEPSPEELKARERARERERRPLRDIKGKQGRRERGERSGGRRDGSRRDGNLRGAGRREGERRDLRPGERRERGSLRDGTAAAQGTGQDFAQRRDAWAKRDRGGALRKNRREHPGREKNRQRFAKVRYPLAQDVLGNVLHMERSNPSLVLDKYLQWPLSALELQAREEARASDFEGMRDSGSTRDFVCAKDSGSAGFQPALSAPLALPSSGRQDACAPGEEILALGDKTCPPEDIPPSDLSIKPETSPSQTPAKPTRPQVPRDYGNWHFSPRNLNFFISRTFVPLYRNFERQALPWEAVRARREAMLRSLEQHGYIVCSELIPGPWRFALGSSPQSAQKQVEGLGEVSLAFDRNFGFPIIPAANLYSLLRRYCAQDGTGNGLSGNGHAPQALNDLLRGGENLIIFDAVPPHKFGQFDIERTRCTSPRWQNDGSLFEQGEEAQVVEYALASGANSAFVFSLAVREQHGERETARSLLNLLVRLIKSANEAYVKPGSAQERRLPQGVVW